MQTTMSACPFCNAVLPALTAPPAADKLPCPRCGELVPAVRWQVDTAIAAGAPKIEPPAAIAEYVPGPRKTLLIVVGVMVTMAVVGLSYALWTTKLRQSRHPRPILDPITFRKPLELAGLGYLPKDSHVIVGLQLAECLADKKVGKPLFDEPRPALLDRVLKQLPRITGMSVEEIDHVLLAGSFDHPQIVMVVRTRRAYALEKIVEPIHPTRSIQHRDHPLYEFSLKPWGDAMLWCVEAKTLVCVIRLDAPKLEHLNGLSATPRNVEEVLPAPLHQALKERLPKQQYLWAVGRLDKLGVLEEALPFLPLGKAEFAAVKAIKTFALGLEPVEGLTLTGYFEMSDAKASAKFKTLLDEVKIEGATSQKIELPPADKEQWVTWQVRGDTAAMRGWLNAAKN